MQSRTMESSYRPPGISPNQDDIAEAINFAFSLWELEESLAGAPTNAHDTVVGSDGDDRLYRPSALDEASEQIARLYSRRVHSLAELAAGVASAVSRVTIQLRAPLHAVVAAEAAVLAASAALTRLGYRLNRTNETDLLLHLYRDRTASPELVQLLASMIEPDVPEPRVAVLTPLTCVGDEAEHEPIVRVGDLVREQLEPEGFRIDCPGLRLHPDSTHDWSPPRMNRAERRRILGVGLVALVTADITSWGLGQSKSWAETNTAIVVEFTNNFSRALAPGNPFGTRTDPWHSPEEAAAAIISLARRHRSRLVAFDADKIEVRQRWTEQMIGAVDLASLKSTRLAVERRDRIVLDPEEAATATLTEMRHLRATNPEVADRVSDILSGRPVYPTLAVDDLPSSSRHNFKTVTTRMAATSQEVDVLLRILAARTEDLVHNRLIVPEGEVERLLFAVRGIAS